MGNSSNRAYFFPFTLISNNYLIINTAGKELQLILLLLFKF